MGEDWKTKGWYQKYHIRRIRCRICLRCKGTKVAPEGCPCQLCGGTGTELMFEDVRSDHTYFVLHFETDPYARVAAAAYADAMEADNPELAADIRKNLAAAWDRVRPKVVCLCGSTRFADAYREANRRETLDGNIVLSIGVDFKTDSVAQEASPEELEVLKEKMDLLHKRKIDMADEILVINVLGYIGDSTKSEIAYAESKRKSVRFWEETNE